ncbi:MAG: methyltransferase domain-containing protein [Alphaproteobacteria bacterium]|nr:methyltransferase domain-containing protein [Alphaproteobacteria bacterium]
MSASDDSRNGIPARAAAQAALTQVLRRRRPLDAALDEVLAGSGLETRDAGFARAIARETLRRLGQLDALIRTFVPKAPPPHRAGATLEILLAGACELLFLDVPPHAAVDAANRLAAADHKALHFKALINAVLRRISREGQAALAKQDTAQLSCPDWLWERWCAAYGEETTRAIAMAHLKEPPLDLVAKTSASVMPDDGTALGGSVFRYSGTGRVAEREGFVAGDWWVQDFAATFPARLFGNVVGRRVLDLCAAPGGKTAQLAALGASVTAVDIDATRLARLSENLARLNLSAEVVARDVRDLDVKPAPFVLLDAPCTATGTIRRHPELPWIKSAAEVTACVAIATDLLDAAARLVAPGGTLVFAVCSLEPEEGVDQIEGFLSGNRDFSRAPLAPGEVLGMPELISQNGDLRTLPCHLSDKGGMDGFYAARLIRSV